MSRAAPSKGARSGVVPLLALEARDIGPAIDGRAGTWPL